ncbi:TRAP transporter small permease [Aquicoccus porphyridii]|uniref:TRAP transporter small permease protein n=1 Tax=Aquicoccus porphyridii TaxID=1852029 RepID=A0A5A9ZVB3_9RHOB|nr:TRAP transporter small permease [Aquicoccus porphyridii]KAA0921129.1 TRAP transporter small permease [Aquicoccus porphyridii]RAI56336.1 TRAP transporter small permease [Rhodobacteraceae bacterium AsT-22]
MAGASPVLEDDSVLSRLDRGLLRVERLMGLVAGLAIFSLMLLAVRSVGGRVTLNAPLMGYVDFIEQLMPLIAILAVSFAQRDGTHIRMDLLVENLRGRALWLFELISVLLILMLMLFLIWGSWAHFQRSFDLGAPWWSRDSTTDIAMPIWPAKLLVPVAFSVLALRLLIQIYGFARALVLGLEKPVAVPMVLDAAAQAAAEAKALEEEEEQERANGPD